MALLNSINSLFETAEQRAEREKYEAERKAFFESIPKRAEQTLIVGQPIESLVRPVATPPDMGNTPSWAARPSV